MPTILVIDDSVGQRAELRSALDGARHFDRILEAEDGLGGLRMLLSEDVDLALCDVEMPGLDGDKLIHVAAQRGIPILMLTSLVDERRRAHLFRQGARDVITKPFQPLDLTARIDLHLELVSLQRELEQKNVELEATSTTDALTGLRNRRYLDEALVLEFKRSVRQGTPLSIVMADIDHFKNLNDTYGHPGGDEVLRAVSDALRQNLRETDVAGRFGGEEFMVVLGASVDGAEIFAERWRQQVEALEVRLEGGSTGVTLSLGIAGRGAATVDPQSLVARADEALYDAKHRGRNCVVVVD